MNDPTLADRLNSLLLNHGISEHAALKPIDALERLLADREDADWRDAFMAALAGCDAALSERRAGHAAVRLAKRRRDRLKVAQR